MVSIETLILEEKVSSIRELEVERYVNFFENSTKDNLEHCKATIKAFPRWSIISGYYAMHDITKLMIAKKFRLKMEREVHATTIKILRELIKDKEVTRLIEKGYKEFISMANDLADAREERTKAQYYTGTAFMRERFQKISEEFLLETVIPYLERIRKLME
ncbi:MAG: hypothetical protein HZB66_02555 [Candidatus Aenigmarchaeota archaeon]|nr:hypothetical protein [Candidatus Aenigmarchaeota archaeon]